MIERLHVIHECPLYMAYVPLHSPKEHMEMKYAAHLHAMEVEANARREQAMRDWQAEQAKLSSKRDRAKTKREIRRDEEKRNSDRKWQDEQRVATIRANRFNALLAVAVGAIISILFAMFKPERPPIINNIVTPASGISSSP